MIATTYFTIVYCFNNHRILTLQDNAPLNSDYRTQISHDGHVLTIPISEASDSGTYLCRAINDAGYGQKQFTVDILGIMILQSSKNKIKSLHFFIQLLHTSDLEH